MYLSTSKLRRVLRGSPSPRSESEAASRDGDPTQTATSVEGDPLGGSTGTRQNECTSADLPLYTYRPLKENEIRVFHLSVLGPSEGEITGRLTTINLDSDEKENAHIEDFGNPRYTALSYAWGPTYQDGSHLTESIVCDGAKLKVTFNLYLALKRIRKTTLNWRSELLAEYKRMHLERLLWIDAICINQEDLQERGFQVQMMSRIFSNCVYLVIWLGEPDEGELGAAQCDLLRDTARDRHSSSVLSRFNRNKVFSRQQDKLTVLQSMLNRPWFKRRWVIQEAATEGVPGYVMMGSADCHRDPFTSLLEKFELLTMANPLQRPLMDRSIFQTLYTYDDSECEDPRDRVFALRNLSRHGYKVQIDYNRDVRDTYLNLVKSVVLGKVELDDFSTHFVGSERQQKWTSNCAEAIMAFAISSCKKRDDVPQTLDHGMEFWIPDWTAKMRFDSSQHREAVEICLRHGSKGTNMELLNFVQRIVVSRNGYSYFSIGGVLTNPYYLRLEDLHPFEAILRFDPSDSLVSWALSVCESTRSHYLQPGCKFDRIWLPMMIYYDEVEGPKTLAFLLRRGETQRTFQNNAVYRIKSCFLIPGPTREDLSRLTSEQSSEEWMKLINFMHWDQFFLE